MMRVIVLGAAGQLGSAVARAFAADDAEVIPLGRSELDIADERQVAALPGKQSDAIVNCAAFNAVDAAEDRIDEAMRANAEAVARLAQAAEASGAVFVHYSSDFVFDGESDRPYTEDDQPAPISAYGRSKLAGEHRAALASRAYVLRLSSVFGGLRGEGAGGSTTIDRMVATTLAGGEVVAFSDRTVTPSYTIDVAEATRQLLRRQAAPGIYHCAGGPPATWTGLAAEIARQLGRPSHVRPVLTSAVTMRARRPRCCAMSNTKLTALGIAVPDWRDALARHLQRCGALQGVTTCGS
jgi:dTDP-4-dehydrorhamnose reductase